MLTTTICTLASKQLQYNDEENHKVDIIMMWPQILKTKVMAVGKEILHSELR